MKFSVACNFDEALLKGLKSYPVHEIYGKLTTDYFGGGRPSFYLPKVGKQEVSDFIKKTHEYGIEFNYLLNASSMGNMEYTREGQREINRTLEWLNEIKVDSITVANMFFLKLIKKRFSNIKVRVSSHRYTNNARKVRFWKEAGADCLVISEVNIHREFKVLEAIREAAGDEMDLHIIVNNWCRQDCAIAGNHAVGLSSGSQKKTKGFPLDYCFLYCNYIRLTDPVNYIRANWIRPEDIPIYEDLGYDTFKIVERNTPTAILLERVKAYYNKKYDGNFLDIIQNYAYPYKKFTDTEKDFFSKKRMFKYFLKPKQINLFKFSKIVNLGKKGSIMYPLYEDNPVNIDNKKLDGFINHFLQNSCEDKDCEKCKYCHTWAQKAVTIEPEWEKMMKEIYNDIFEELYSGSFWDSHIKSINNIISKKIIN